MFRLAPTLPTSSALAVSTAASAVKPPTPIIASTVAKGGSSLEVAASTVPITASSAPVALSAPSARPAMGLTVAMVLVESRLLYPVLSTLRLWHVLVATMTMT